MHVHKFSSDHEQHAVRCDQCVHIVLSRHTCQPVKKICSSNLSARRYDVCNKIRSVTAALTRHAIGKKYLAICSLPLRLRDRPTFRDSACARVLASATALASCSRNESGW